jgi:hypothetical protein
MNAPLRLSNVRQRIVLNRTGLIVSRVIAQNGGYTLAWLALPVPLQPLQGAVFDTPEELLAMCNLLWSAALEEDNHET